MITLVDTSVWRHYFNGTLPAEDKPRMDSLLDQDDAIACYVAIIGELVLGGLSPAHKALITRLPRLPEISGEATLQFITEHNLSHRGVGWVDCQLLACAVRNQALVWAMDKRFMTIAEEMIRVH